MGSGESNWPLGVFVVLAGVGLFMGIEHFRDKLDFNKFDAHMKEWTAEPKTTVKEPYVRGRVLPVLRSFKTSRVRGKYPAVDQQLYWTIPEDLRARSIEEVGTVLLLDWTEDTRTAPGPNPFVVQVTACIEHCQITLVDPKANRKIVTKMYRGKDPDKLAPGEPPISRMYPEPPYQAIVEFIQGLPKRDS